MANGVQFTFAEGFLLIRDTKQKVIFKLLVEYAIFKTTCLQEVIEHMKGTQLSGLSFMVNMGGHSVDFFHSEFFRLI
jgi:hypothetical protein